MASVRRPPARLRNRRSAMALAVTSQTSGRWPRLRSGPICMPAPMPLPSLIALRPSRLVALRQCSADRRAALGRGMERRAEDKAGGAVQIIRAAQGRDVLSARLEQGRDKVPRGGRADRAPRRRRAAEADAPGIGLGHRLAGGAPWDQGDLDEVFRKVVLRGLGQHAAARRRELRRLQDDRVAEARRRADLAQWRHGQEIPRRDAKDHAARPAQDLVSRGNSFSTHSRTNAATDVFPAIASDFVAAAVPAARPQAEREDYLFNLPWHFRSVPSGSWQGPVRRGVPLWRQWRGPRRE